MKSSLFFLHSDARVLDLIRKGNEEALVILFEENRRPIYSYVTRNSGTADDAEDMLQESLVILWERVRSGRFEYAAKLSTFIFATVKNLWSRRLAKQRREYPTELDPEIHSDANPSALDAIIDAENVELVTKALARIGEQCRKLLTLYYWEELSMEEIAASLGFANAATAKAKKYQCKEALKKALRQLGS